MLKVQKRCGIFSEEAEWEGRIWVVGENPRESDVSEEKVDFYYCLLKNAQKQYPEVERTWALEKEN